jgi:uncharacterized protein (TIGR02001 family)
MKKILSATAAVALLLGGAAHVNASDFTANISASNNYLWRGLTQSDNGPAVSGGIDYGHDSGFYVGTWVSNVNYGAGDPFSYEHDMYAGYSGEYNEVTYDFGYLYYNYDEQANFDFSEVYGSLGYRGFSVTAYVLAHAETEENSGVGQDGGNYDFGFGSAFYISGDYAFEIREGLELGLHVGYHDGDFVDAFNFADGTFNYVDYNISLAKGGFGFMVSHTDIGDNATQNGGGLNNDSVKFVVSYTVDFEL